MSRPSSFQNAMWHGPAAKSRLVALSLCVLLLAFWPTLQSFHGVWTRYTYSHGYLIPPVVLWLAWQRRGALLDAVAGAPLALAPLALLSGVWLVAVVTNVQVIHQGLLPVMMLLWVAAVAGWGAARRLLPAALVFLFAVPFWEVFTRPLQLMTIAVTSTLVRALGIEAEITGEYITISSGTFEVAGSCAGLNFFIVGLLLGLLYAHLYVDRWRTRAGIMAVAVGLALVANWVRVTGLVVIGYVTEMQWEHLEEHGFYGWVIFAAFMVVFFFVAGRMAGRRARGGGGADDGAASPPAGEDAEAPGRSLGGRLGLATASAVLGPALYLVLSVAPAAATPAWTDPEASEGWTLQASQDSLPRGWEPDFPPADERRTGVWTDGTTRIHQLVLLYDEQEQGRELIGDDSRIASSAALALDRPLWISEKGVMVREALVRTPDGPVVVWYWYRVGGVRATSALSAKALEFWAFLRRRPSAALVTVSVACVSELCETERLALRDFVAAR